MLQVCFTIQILGLNIANSFGRRAVEQEQVTWEVLVLINLDDLSNPDLLPPFGHELVYPFLLALEAAIPATGLLLS